MTKWTHVYVARWHRSYLVGRGPQFARFYEVPPYQALRFPSYQDAKDALPSWLPNTRVLRIRVPR